MSPELENKLAENFEFMRRKKSASEQLSENGSITDLYSAFGCDCADGWYDLINDLCIELKHTYIRYSRPMDLEVLQVKQKFGTLRFYYHINSDDRDKYEKFYKEIEDIVEAYEEKSATICELCGEDGKIVNNGWVRCLCSECEEREKNKRTIYN